MHKDRRNLLMNREILNAYITVIERPDELIQVCSAVSGDDTNLRSAVAEAFNVSDIAADAILALQVRRFTPASLEQIQHELAALDRHLATNRP